MGVSLRAKIPRLRPPAPYPISHRTLRRSAPCLNAIRSKFAARSAKLPHKIRANFQLHPPTRSFQEISSKKKLRGGNRASGQKEKFYVFHRRLRKTSPVSGNARSLR